MSCDCFDILFKIFIVIFIFGPVLSVAVLLILMALVANVFTLLYFSLIGWLCEAEICTNGCHKKFIVNALKKPWEPLFIYAEKIYNLFANPMIERT